MAKFKKKVNKVESVEAPVNTEETSVEAVEEVSESGTEYAETQEQVSSERMHKVLELLQEDFDIKHKNFELTGYNDKGTKIEATLKNPDYEVKFTLKSNIIIKLS